MMRLNLVCLMLTIISLLIPALSYCQVDTAWVRRYNGPGNDADEAHAIAVDGVGNVYVTGYSVGSGTYPNDYATIKYNSAGETLWVRRYDGPGARNDEACAIAVDGAGNVYVTGFSYGANNDYATIKYDSTGVPQWVKRYNGPGNSSDYAKAIAVDGAGNVYVTGQSSGSGTGQDYATIKYNSAGETLWVRRYDAAGTGDDAYAIAVDGAGNVYVTGKIRGGTARDYATIKYNSAGEQQWVATYNGLGNSADEAYAIAVDGAGNVYLTGTSYGSGTDFDYTTIKYIQTGGIEERTTLNAISLTPEIYPNPAKGVVRVRGPLNEKTIKIFDKCGKMIKEIATTASQSRNDGAVVISLKGINPGIYFLQLGTEIRKFLVVR